MFPWERAAALQRMRREILLRSLLGDMMFGEDGDDDDDDDDHYHIHDVDEDSEEDHATASAVDPLLNPIHRVIDSMTDAQRSGRGLIQPDVLWDSEVGRRLRKEADEAKEKGNLALKNKNYELAIGFYTEALIKAYRLTENKELVGTLLSNRSSVLCLVKEFDQALDDAKHCVFCRPSWIKGSFRLMRAHVGLKEFQEAFSVGIAATRHYKCSKEEMLEMFIEILVLLPDVTDYSDLTKLKIEDDGWKVFLYKLSNRKSWEAISVLFQGREGSPPILTSYKATDLFLSGLLDSCSAAQWKSWGQRLAVKLLQAGAKMASLDPEKKHGAHAAFKMCMKTGEYELLKHLFLRHIPTDDRDRVDDEGNTLLHLACRGIFPTKLIAVKLLLEHELRPLCRNRLEQRPLDLLPKNDRDRADIVKAMRDKGFDTKSLTTEASNHLRTDSPHLAATSSKPLASGVAGASSGVLNWNTRKVESWLLRNKLADIREKMKDVDGSQLMELKRLQETAAPTFYQLLHGTLGLSFVQLLAVASAIRNLVADSRNA